MKITASKEWKEGQEKIQSEMRAPRKIIKYVLMAQIIEIGMLVYLIFK